MTERKWTIGLLLLALGLVLAACGTAAQEDNPAPATTVAAIDEPTEAAATATPLPAESLAPTETPTAEPTEDIQEDTSNGPEILTTDDRSDLLKQITEGWNTNWNQRTIPYDEITPVLFRDAIRSLDEPTFESVAQAADWLPTDDPVVVFELDGDARAYPLRILTNHEIVNDVFGDVPVAVTYCPLCNAAVVFDRRFDGQVLEFGTSGMLRNSDLIMYDRTTETLWQQFTGEGIVGDLAGERLDFLPSAIVSFVDFGQAFPDGQVLSANTGFRFDYSLRSYDGYDVTGTSPFLFFGEIDPRLPAVERVVSISLPGVDIAYPLSVLQEVGVINDSRAGQDLVVFHSPGTKSAFYDPVANVWADVGATGVFDPNLDGQKLTFVRDGEQITDEQTGSVWNVLGQAVEGPLAGSQLARILHADHFWFSWAAFKPDTLVYGSE